MRMQTIRYALLPAMLLFGHAAACANAGEASRPPADLPAVSIDYSKDPPGVTGTVTEPPNFKNGASIQASAQQRTATGSTALALDPQATFSQSSVRNTTNDDTVWASKDEFRIELEAYVPSGASDSPWMFSKYAGISRDPAFDTEDGAILYNTGRSNLSLRWLSEGSKWVSLTTSVLSYPRDQYVLFVYMLSVNGNLPFGQTLRIEVYDGEGRWIGSAGTTAPIKTARAQAMHTFGVGNDTTKPVEIYFRSARIFRTLRTSWDRRGQVSVIAFQGSTPAASQYQHINSIVGVQPGVRAKDLLDTRGAATGLSYEIVGNASPSGDGMERQGGEILDFVSEPIVLKESHASKTGKVLHTIHAPDGIYRITCAGSSRNRKGRSTYTVNGQSQSLDTGYNSRNGCVFVVSPVAGVINLEFEGVLAAVEIERLPP